MLRRQEFAMLCASKEFGLSTPPVVLEAILYMHNVVKASSFSLPDFIGNPSSIAIVGNSPKIKEAEHGAAIDGHDVVMRFNDGPFRGFEKHAGSRTDVRYIGLTLREEHESFFSNLDEESKLLSKDKNDALIEKFGISERSTVINNYSRITRTAFEKLNGLIPIDSIPKAPPRSGIVVLSMLAGAMAAGLRVSLYGYDIAKRDSGRLHFYGATSYNNAASKWDKFHCPMEYEFRVLRDMEDAGFISIA